MSKFYCNGKKDFCHKGDNNCVVCDDCECFNGEGGSVVVGKEVKVICPKCGNEMTYKNYWSWIWHTPFHWFGKRKAKCTKCGEVLYMGRKR